MVQVWSKRRLRYRRLSFFPSNSRSSSPVSFAAVHYCAKKIVWTHLITFPEFFVRIQELECIPCNFWKKTHALLILNPQPKLCKNHIANSLAFKLRISTAYFISNFIYQNSYRTTLTVESGDEMCGNNWKTIWTSWREGGQWRLGFTIWLEWRLTRWVHVACGCLATISKYIL